MTTPNTTPLFPGPTPGTLRCFNPRCGHVWIQRTPRTPFRCPRCQSRHWYNPSWHFKTRPLPEPTPTMTDAQHQEALNAVDATLATDKEQPCPTQNPQPSKS